jgi:hypothetical protein
MVADMCSRKIRKFHEWFLEFTDNSCDGNRVISILDSYSNHWTNSRNAYLKFTSVKVKKENVLLVGANSFC